jgi:hypothetical protein
MIPAQVQESIDKYFSHLLERNINCSPWAVPADMALGEADEEGLTQWRPIASRVTYAELKITEELLGVRISPQYASILQYKHFMELQVGDLNFFAHPSTGWRERIAAQVFRGHPRALLFDRGFVPFANWDDWGLYCFRIEEVQADSEYAVYRWDHDDPQQFERVSSDLYGALIGMTEK